MAFTLPELPYAYDALEPTIDAKTMEVHHSKHHQAYVDKLNAAIKDTERDEKSLEEILQSLDILPANIKNAVRNNGGGVWNHNIFWKSLTPGGKPISDSFKAVLEQSFGSVEEFKTLFTAAGMGHFGSGWVWLVKDYEDIVIKTTPNQDTPLMLGEKAILAIDLWEHAYYLKHQNRRADYLEDIWGIIDWDFVEQQYNNKY